MPVRPASRAGLARWHARRSTTVRTRADRHEAPHPSSPRLHEARTPKGSGPRSFGAVSLPAMSPSRRENMQPFEFEKKPRRRARAAAAAFAVVASFATFAAVVAVFASASGEMESMVAAMKGAPPASQAVAKAPG